MPEWCNWSVGTKRLLDGANRAPKVQRGSVGSSANGASGTNGRGPRPGNRTRRARAQLNDTNRAQYEISSIPDSSKKLMVCLLKSGLNLHQRQRNLEGCLLDTFLTPDSQKVAEEMYATKDAYAERVRSEGAGHDAGSPDIHEFLALIKGLLSSDIGGQNSKRLTGIMDEINKMGQHDLQQFVKLCTIKESHDDGVAKITVHVAKEQWRFCIVDCFKQIVGITHKAGRPPPSGFEDDMSKFLEALTIS